ncbi:hypothetical protein BT63DRAFT_422646 [Microthyrium microscopicum]|uniref:Uncharacterized protein n=1 Tax=Microthyrium microscopicum TaxID=703497 RepID=A0A6A6UL11_9PEZI|nr:hypothetical protein BT63DRAFT_422646 [Microthyrium microscopicum]
MVFIPTRFCSAEPSAAPNRGFPSTSRTKGELDSDYSAQEFEKQAVVRLRPVQTRKLAV